MSAETGQDPLYTHPDLVQFYDIENRWADDFTYCAELAKAATSVLDLGCGTGELAAALAKGRRVVGVDPAAAMLDIAKRRVGGGLVRWVQADARTLDLDERFDLILLTGHAFQVFLSDTDQAAVLQSIARHLTPEGRYIFDSRNPAAKAWQNWTPVRSRRQIEHPTLGLVDVWNDARLDEPTELVRYQTFYQAQDGPEAFSAEAKIRFTSQQALAARLQAAGLSVNQWLGNWGGDPLHNGSKEIIPIGGLLR